MLAQLTVLTSLPSDTRLGEDTHLLLQEDVQRGET